MLSARKLTLVALSLLAMDLVACSKSDSHPASTTTISPAPKPTGTTPASAVTTAVPTGKIPDILSPDEAISLFQADKTSLMGKTVKIKGYYFDYTKQDDVLNVEITPKPEITSKGALCIFPGSAKAALDKVKKHTVVTVSGTVDGEFFGRPKLKACKLE